MGDRLEAAAGTNLTDAQETVAAMAEDAASLPAPLQQRLLQDELRQRQVQVLATSCVSAALMAMQAVRRNQPRLFLWAASILSHCRPEKAMHLCCSLLATTTFSATASCDVITARQSLHEASVCHPVQAVSFEDWLKLDAAEVSRGLALGKAREKALDVSAMLASCRVPVTKASPY